MSVHLQIHKKYIYIFFLQKCSLCGLFDYIDLMLVWVGSYYDIRAHPRGGHVL